MNNIIEIGFIGLQLILFLVCYKLMRKRLMHPAILYSFIWFVVILLHFIFKNTLLNQLYDVKPFTFLFIFLGTFCFCFGSLIAGILHEKKRALLIKNKYPEWQTDFSPTLQTILILLLTIGLPVYIYKSYQVFLASNIENFLVGLRTELSYGDTDLGVIKYLNSFSFLVLAVQQYCYYKNRTAKNRFFFVFALVISLIIAIFTTGRGPLLWVFSILLAINFLHGRKFSAKQIIIALSAFIVVFSFIGMVFQKGGSLDDTFRENVEESAKVTGVYLVASVNAFDATLHDNTLPDYSGDNSFRLFKLIAKVTGILPNAEIREIVQDFIFVPYPTNVYTIYHSYYADFGIYYTLLLITLIGLVQTILYYKAIQTKNIRYTLYYSLTLFPLLMSFFQDMYLSLLSTWIQIIVYIEIIILINRISTEND